MARVIGGQQFEKFWINTDSQDPDCRVQIDPNLREVYNQKKELLSKSAYGKNMRIDFQAMDQAQTKALIVSGVISGLDGYYVMEGGTPVKMTVATKPGQDSVFEMLKNDSGLRNLITAAVNEPHDEEAFRQANPWAVFSVDEVAAKNSEIGSNGTRM